MEVFVQVIMIPLHVHVKEVPFVIESAMLFQIDGQHQRTNWKNHVTMCAGCPELLCDFHGMLLMLTHRAIFAGHMLFYLFQPSKKPVLSQMCTEICVCVNICISIYIEYTKWKCYGTAPFKISVESR